MPRIRTLNLYPRAVIGRWRCPVCGVRAPWQHRDHACALCGRDVAPHTCSQPCRSPDCRRGMVLDHDHVTGRPRAYLCRSCNGRVGRVETGRGEDAAVAAYLEAHR